MGLVFRASDLTLGRTVAMKVIAPDVAGKPVFRTRFERECRAAAAIDHPHVVQIYHAGEDEGMLYLTMRFVDGTDLRRLLRRERRLDPGRAVSIVGQIAGGLDEAHAWPARPRHDRRGTRPRRPELFGTWWLLALVALREDRRRARDRGHRGIPARTPQNDRARVAT
jgi:hypothetical protein